MSDTPAMHAVSYLSHRTLGPSRTAAIVPWSVHRPSTGAKSSPSCGYHSAPTRCTDLTRGPEGDAEPAEWCTNHGAPQVVEGDGVSGHGCTRTYRGRLNIPTRRGAIPGWSRGTLRSLRIVGARYAFADVQRLPPIQADTAGAIVNGITCVPASVSAAGRCARGLAGDGGESGLWSNCTPCQWAFQRMSKDYICEAVEFVKFLDPHVYILETCPSTSWVPSNRARLHLPSSTPHPNTCFCSLTL